MIEACNYFNMSIEELMRHAILITAVDGKKGADSDVYQSGDCALHMYHKKISIDLIRRLQEVTLKASQHAIQLTYPFEQRQLQVRVVTIDRIELYAERYITVCTFIPYERVSDMKDHKKKKLLTAILEEIESDLYEPAQARGIEIIPINARFDEESGIIWITDLYSGVRNLG